MYEKGCLHERSSLEVPRRDEASSGRCVYGQYMGNKGYGIPDSGVYGSALASDQSEHNQPRGRRNIKGCITTNERHRGVTGRCVMPINLYTGSSRGVSGCTSNLFSQRAADDLDGSKPAGSESDPSERGCQTGATT